MKLMKWYVFLNEKIKDEDVTRIDAEIRRSKYDEQVNRINGEIRRSKYYAKKIIKWMEDNKLDIVDIIPNIKFGGQDYQKLVYKGKETYVISYCKFFDNFKSGCFDPYTNNELITLGGEVLMKEIWNYLQKLTPEKIEDQRAKNEADKFNF